MYPAYNPTSPTPPTASNHNNATNNSNNQKKKHRNPFTFLFAKQHKSTPTSTIVTEDKQGIFGVPLCDASKLGSILWDLQVPDPVALCFLEISKRGLTTEGIFRLSGATSEVIALENKINMCSPDERKQINPNEFDIHTLTSLVKKYLRELPEPVIPNAFHEQFQDIDLEDERVGLHQLSQVIVKLPFYNRQLLHSILLMASRVQQHVQLNMMCPEALATVFAPVCTGFEQSLKDMRISSSTSTTTTSSTFKKQKKFNHNEANYLMKSSQVIEKHIKRNKNWTNIWKMMIEQHESLISILDKQHYQSMENNRTNQELTWKNHRVYYQQQHHNYQQQQPNRSLPSPFSTSGSTTPLPNDIIMAQFYPLNQNSIPVAQPSHHPNHYHGSSNSGSINNGYNSSNLRHESPPPPLQYHKDLPPPPLPTSTTSTSSSRATGFQHSISKKASFFQKSNTIRKILSASTLR